MLRWPFALCLAVAWSAAALVLNGFQPAQAYAGVAATDARWCGTSAPSTDLPDSVAGPQWHVVYAVPVGGDDRLGMLAPGIVADLRAIERWWRLQDPTRTLNLDRASMPGCDEPLADLDITHLSLPRPSWMFDRSDAIGTLAGDLAAAGLDDPRKKYLVYLQAGGGSKTRCGEANTGVAGGGAKGLAVVYLGACDAVVGTGETSAAVTAAHEMVHALDALAAAGPPNACAAPDAAHVCDARRDILHGDHPTDVRLAELLLDVGRDDYYDHPGAWWDVRDSPFLAVVTTTDTTPPGSPSSLTATSRGRSLTVRWNEPADETELVYRIAVDGTLSTVTGEPLTRLEAAVGSVVTVAVQAVDQAGLAGFPALLRFRVGYGVVDEQGVLIADTVPPPPVGGLRTLRRDGRLYLRWAAVSDRGGPLAGYEVLRNGRRVAFVRTTRSALPRDSWQGAWWVRAVDGAGNVGRRADVLYLRLRD